MLSAKYLLVRKGLRKQKADPSRSVEEMRKHMSRLARLFPAPKGTRSDPITINGVHCEWVATEATRDDGPIILYFHGGGYVAGSPSSHRHLVSRLCSASCGRALVVDYRLAPEHIFPAQMEDGLATYAWLLEKHSPDKVVVVGDSAGGGLAISTLLAARKEKLAMPKAAVTMSGWFDCAGTGDSLTERATADPILWPETIHLLASYFLGEQDRTLPLASPLYADLTSLPPLLLQVGTDEVLFDDTTRFAQKAREAGVEVTVDIGEDLFHVWQFMARVLPEGEEAISRAGQFIMKMVPFN